MSEAIIVGMAATKGAWSSSLRTYLRDHTQGIAIEVIMDRAHLLRVAPRLDVLVIDDIMRLFSPADIAFVSASGVTVVGMYDALEGLGCAYLMALGVERAVDVTTPVTELAALISQVKPREKRHSISEDWGSWPGAGRASDARRQADRALLSVWTKAAGGVGLTESVIAAAELLAKKARVLLIELDELAPVLVSRLLRSPDTGLSWALSRAALGRPVLPEGLSGPRGDGVVPLGKFDAICATQGANHVINPTHFMKLLAQVEGSYDHILVEACWLVGAPSERERFSASRAALARADRVVVISASDPEGAARLVDWRAAASATSVTAPCLAAFGRASASRYERDHLVSLVSGGTGSHQFTSLSVLPEDNIVRRARWNGEMVWKGPWLRAVRSLVSSSVALAPSHRRSRHWANGSQLGAVPVIIGGTSR